jgi:hypothetical protein
MWNARRVHPDPSLCAGARAGLARRAVFQIGQYVWPVLLVLCWEYVLQQLFEMSGWFDDGFPGFDFVDRPFSTAQASWFDTASPPDIATDVAPAKVVTRRHQQFP